MLQLADVELAPAVTSQAACGDADTASEPASSPAHASATDADLAAQHNEVECMTRADHVLSTGNAQMLQKALALYRQAADHMKGKLQNAQRYANAAQDLAKLRQLSDDAISARQAFNVCMEVTRLWDQAGDRSAQRGWGLEVCSKVNSELQACHAPVLHHTRMTWYRKNAAASSPKEHRELFEMKRWRVWRDGHSVLAASSSSQWWIKSATLRPATAPHRW
jgi:hypothetical protein